MLRILITGILWSAVSLLHAQVSDLIAGEYFIDHDPGYGMGTALSFTQGDTVNVNTLIPSTGLSSGVHRLYLRFKDTDNAWGMASYQQFAVVNASASTTSQLQELEYFVDTDPGHGLATSIAIAAADTVNLLDLIPTSDLSVGVHYLYTRCKNTNGAWGLSDYQPFFIAQNSPEESPIPIQAIEYFIDEDPGHGSATSIPITVVDTLELSDLIPSSGISSGAHHLYLRALDLDGNWGMVDRQPFFISDSASTNSEPSPLVSIEYFIDHDPGYGLGTPLSIAASDTVSLSALVDTDGLATGIHHLYTRCKNEDQTWGAVSSEPFYVSASSEYVISDLDGWEYFFDEDPGVGNANFVSVPLSDTLNIFQYLDVSALSDGDHTIGVRIRNEDGAWGMSELSTFHYLHCEDSLLEMGSDFELCSGDQLVLEASSEFDFYYWNTTDTTQTLTVSDEAHYHYSVLDSVAMVCYQSDTVFVNEVSPPNSDFTFTYSFANAEFDNVDAEQTLLWEFGDGNTSTFNDPTHSFAVSGEYTFTLTAANACGISQSTDSALLCTDYPTPPTWFADDDGDGFGNALIFEVACEAPEGFVDNNSDCDDTNAVVYPNAPGTAEDIDNNCNGFIDTDELMTCLGDLNADGQINTTDLLSFLGTFGCTESCVIGDFNEDGAVNTSDLLFIIGLLGSSCN